MAKPFYSIEEVCEKLGKSEDEVKDLVRDGALREFRDAGKVFFKSDEVDKLSGGGSAADEIALEPADDELPSLADESGGTSVLGLAPIEDEDPAPAPAPVEEKKNEGTVITSSGIGVFDDDELEIDADPMAATQVDADSGIDQVSLEGTGGGSGLLDLTRESDDTSLGAELLDEIYPGEEESTDTPEEPVAALEDSDAGAPAPAEPEPVAEEPVAAPVAMAAPIAVGDASEGMFSGLALGSTLLLVVAASIAASGLQGFYPAFGSMLTQNFWMLLGGAALVPVICLAFGWVFGRMGR